MNTLLQLNTDRDDQIKKKGLAIFMFLFMIMILFIPWFNSNFPPPQEQGVLVSFGMPDFGQGDDSPKVQNKEKDVAPSENTAAKKVEKEEDKKITPVASKKPVVTSKEEEKVVVVNKKDSKQEEADAKVQREAEARKVKEAEEAKRKADAIAEAKKKEAEYKKAKSQFGSFLSGSGKGDNDKPGNTGQTNGDPKSDILKGISTGSGRVGGGLSNRGLVFEPEVKDNSQEEGKVVMKVCVDQTGAVTSSEYTLRGSTSQSPKLIEKAKRAAKKYKFSASEIEEQCGTISFNFKLQ